MKLVRTFKISCCGQENSFSWEYEALERLLHHVKYSHKALWKKLEKRGRELARSQNGLGYSDYDHSNGWRKAQPWFRDAWREKALKEHLCREK